MVVVRPSEAVGRKVSRGLGPDRDLVTQIGPGVWLWLLDEVRRVTVVCLWSVGSSCPWLI